MRMPRTLLPLFAVLAGACSAETTAEDEGDANATTEALAAPGPDLTVTAVTGPASLDGSYGRSRFVATATICNRGTTPAYGETIDVRLSSDATVNAQDPLAGSAFVPPLGPNECTAVSVDANLPPLATGAYYLGAIVDPANSVAETNEANNTKAGALIGVGAGPDLVVTGATTTASVAGPFAVATTICNQGTAPSGPSAVEIRLSADTTISAADALAGTMDLQPLYPGQCATISVNASAPFPPGAYYLGAVVDPRNAVMELIETNDTFTGKLTGVGPGPDLVVSSVSAPSSATPGPFTATAAVCNQGTQPSPPSNLELRLSPDSVIDATDPLAGRVGIPHLYPGQCTTATVNANTGGVATGAYRLGAIIDPENAIAELIETNDTNAGRIIGIGSLPDLVVTGLTGPATIAGGPVSAVATVCNQGTAASTGATLDVRLSTDTTITMTDAPVGSANVPYLQPGQCTPVIVDGTAGWAPYGAAYLGAIVDSTNMVSELVETNNAYTGKLVGVGDGPDLVVTKVTGPGVIAGSSFTGTVTVCNQGTQAVYGSSVELRLSADPTITSSDAFAGAAGVPALAAGVCTNVDISSWYYPTGPFPSAPIYIGAIVDPTNDVRELVESNNSLAGKLTGTGFGPDLVISAVTGPSSVAAGPFTATVTACNQGNEPVNGGDITVLLSTDTTITMDDIVAGFGSTLAIGPGQCTKLDIPANAIPFAGGAYYLGAIIDARNGIPELIETNNTNAGRLIGVGYGPDLVVTSLTIPASMPARSTGSALATVCNQGTAPTYDGAMLELHASADASVTTADQPAGYASVPALAPGQCAGLTLTTTFFGFEVGSFYVAAIVDPRNTVPELIETNNVSTVRRVTLQQ